jgi:hypothetical protein
MLWPGGIGPRILYLSVLKRNLKINSHEGFPGGLLWIATEEFSRSVRVVAMATTHFFTSLEVTLIELLEDLPVRRDRLIEGDDCARVCALMEPARGWGRHCCKKVEESGS